MSSGLDSASGGSGGEATRTADPGAGFDTWAAKELVEFVGALSGRDSREASLQAAIERFVVATGSAAGAIVGGDRVLASVGLESGAGAHEELLREPWRDGAEIELGGGRWAHSLSIPIEGELIDSLVLARQGLPFGRLEKDLLDAGNRVLTLVISNIETTDVERHQRLISEHHGLENERLLTSLAERQKLFERLSRIQSSIVSRLAIDDVLDAIVAGAAELLGDDTVALRLVDRNDPERMCIVAAQGIAAEKLEGGREGRVGEGAGGRAISEENLVVIEGYGDDPSRINHWAGYGVKSAMATPVREGGRVVGSLVVAREQLDHGYTEAEREILVAFANHASIALTDARTVQDAIHEALHDPLTKLPNRTLLLDRLSQALARAESSASEVAILFCDLDQFKTVNDSLGHVAGDELLVAVGERLLSCVRPGDTAARFGGDEFAVLIESIAGVEVEDVARRILRTLEEPFSVRGKEVFLSGSIGIATGRSTTDDLLRDADLAMYRAKRGGAGRHETFAPHMHASVVERLELEAELKRGISDDQLIVNFQPIIELPTGRLSAAEALVRWRHPTRGELPPGEFITAAEETGMIFPLGRFVLFEACSTVARWQREVPLRIPLSVSVNVSVLQLEHDGLIEDVEEALRESGLTPGTLTLELTETALALDPAEMAARLERLNDLNVELAIDDFGTGFSSLQHLQHYPIDSLKIPKPFIDTIGGTGDDAALTRAIIDIGHSLGLRTIAEGIERPEQLQRLIELDCRYGQGFLLARPMPADRLREDLERRAHEAEG